MWVHWKKKKLRMPHNGKRIWLKGITDDLTKCSRVTVHKLQGFLKRKAMVQCVELLPMTPAVQDDLGQSICSVDPSTSSVSEMTMPAAVPVPLKIQFSVSVICRSFPSSNISAPI